jgi:DNA repair exonuclease SbcCD ATPase subunit
MAETEIESVLRQIRERVLAEQRSAPTGSVPLGDGGNGLSEPDGLEMTRPLSETITEDNLLLINSYLTTTARTWDRLPPLVSNRSGGVAKLELWLKRQLKRATRWFTWEQVNFNASVHHALRDLLPILSTQAQELANLREQIEQTAKVQQLTSDQHQSDLLAQRGELEMQQRAIEAQQIQLEAQRSEIEEQREQAAGLVNELRERMMHLQEEQRVSSRQLALETSEAATLADRARRKTEALLAELQRRIDELGKGKSD